MSEFAGLIRTAVNGGAIEQCPFRAGLAPKGRRFIARSFSYGRAWQIVFLLILILTACSQSPTTAVNSTNLLTIQLTADNQTQALTTQTSTVRQLLAEAEIELGDLDEVTPPTFTPLTDNLDILIVRVAESLDIIQQTIPFERKFVRSESMEADAPPIIVQAGQAGLQETTWRIVYRDGLESERWPTSTVQIEEPLDEIVRIGIGSAGGNLQFAGTLAYISDGTAVILDGATAFPQQLDTGGSLDGRVFSLSPDGEFLLYTRPINESGSFANSLWVVGTAPAAEPVPLDVENILWAGWNPSQLIPYQIGYSSARPTNAPPGWEANNDLWIGQLQPAATSPFTSTEIIEAYPATYGWWGGNYAWSPNGRFIAYSYADEVGVLAISPDGFAGQRTQLQKFTEYNTLSNWVWVPTLTWSPDSQLLAFTHHGGNDDQAQQFDSWIVNVSNGAAGRVVQQTGMWGHLQWTSTQDEVVGNGRIAYLRAIDPLDSQRSNYTLWLMDQDGSNGRQLYPPIGENSRFPRTPNFLAWSPLGESTAIIFDDDLFLLDITTGAATRITQDDATSSHPTWSPYGIGLTGPPPQTGPKPIPTATPSREELFLPDE